MQIVIELKRRWSWHRQVVFTPYHRTPPCMNAGMNPVRLWAVFELRSYGVNVLKFQKGKS